MKRYEEKGFEWLISKPRGLFLDRRRRSLRRGVIDFNNSVRKILNLSKRPYDETHNRTVKKTNYQ